MNLAIPTAVRAPVNFLNVTQQVESEVDAKRNSRAGTFACVVLEERFDLQCLLMAMLSIELHQLAVNLVRFFETRMVHSLVPIPFLAVLVLIVEMLVECLKEVLVGLESALLERHYHVNARDILDLLGQAVQNGFSQLLDRNRAVHRKSNRQWIPLVLDYVNF